MPFVETTASVNVLVSLAAALLGTWFIRHLWTDVLHHRDIGSIGFLMVFVTVFLFDIWDIIIYVLLFINHGDTTLILPLTTLKPGIHTFEIFAYLLLYLHFRKK